MNCSVFRFFQVIWDDVKRGHNFKLFKKRYSLDVGKFKFAGFVRNGTDCRLELSLKRH